MDGSVFFFQNYVNVPHEVKMASQISIYSRPHLAVSAPAYFGLFGMICVKRNQTKGTFVLCVVTLKYSGNFHFLSGSLSPLCLTAAFLIQ